jgi:hypothetical protein
MLKKIIVLMVILSVFLAACQSAASEPTAESPVEPETTSTDLPPLPEVSPTPGSEQATEQAEANCTVVSRQPPAGSTEPLVTDNDWTQGPDDAAVTFIEYSDFQ